jgi:hypothetical protein
MKQSPTITKATIDLDEEGYRLTMSISDGNSFENLSVKNTAAKLKEYVGEFSTNDLMFAGLSKAMANAVMAFK